MHNQVNRLFRELEIGGRGGDGMGWERGLDSRMAEVLFLFSTDVLRLSLLFPFV